jgi:hypothetical protein
MRRASISFSIVRPMLKSSRCRRCRPPCTSWCRSSRSLSVVPSVAFEIVADRRRQQRGQCRPYRGQSRRPSSSRPGSAGLPECAACRNCRTTAAPHPILGHDPPTGEVAVWRPSGAETARAPPRREPDPYNRRQTPGARRHSARTLTRLRSFDPFCCNTSCRLVENEIINSLGVFSDIAILQGNRCWEWPGLTGAEHLSARVRGGRGAE